MAKRKPPTLQGPIEDTLAARVDELLDLNADLKAEVKRLEADLEELQDQLDRYEALDLAHADRKAALDNGQRPLWCPVLDGGLPPDFLL